MKKIISFLTACLLAISFVACSSDDETGTNAPDVSGKETAAQYQTEIVTDEKGETSIVEVPVPVETDGAVTGGEVSQQGGETEKPSLETGASTEAPATEADTTRYPVEDNNPIEDLDGMALVNAAYDKMNTLSSYEYVAVSNMSAMDETMEYTVNTVFKDTSDGIQYLSEMLYEGDVMEGVYHKNGYTYQTIDEVPFKGKMSKAEFKEYLLEIGMNTNEYARAFKKMETEKNGDGATVILSELDISAIEDLSMEDLEEMGATVNIKEATGKIVISKDGYILSEHVAIDLEITIMGMKQSVVVSADTEVKNVNSVGKVNFPSFDGYVETPCIAGLYRLTQASYAYDDMTVNGMAFEMDSNINITGAETVSDIASAECEYSYKTSLLATKIILDMYAEGSLNGEPQSMSAVSDGKNLTLSYNGEETKMKYNEDIVWELLSEMIEYTFGYASCIDDISEKKENGGYKYTYDVNEEYAYYLFERAAACIEDEIGYDDLADISFEEIKGTSAVDKNGELTEFSNCAVFSFTTVDGKVYNVDYEVTVRVNS